ncbi:hypothetical protein CL622_06565 [archaeon]|nr:hypothetical protein [archaeon]|tara:strand:- start:876 stop:1268 length:393 start_codon:yes stop_codon:yes gene_type:complete
MNKRGEEALSWAFLELVLGVLVVVGLLFNVNATASDTKVRNQAWVTELGYAIDSLSNTNADTTITYNFEKKNNKEFTVIFEGNTITISDKGGPQTYQLSKATINTLTLKNPASITIKKTKDKIEVEAPWL